MRAPFVNRSNLLKHAATRCVFHFIAGKVCVMWPALYDSLLLYAHHMQTGCNEDRPPDVENNPA